MDGGAYFIETFGCQMNEQDSLRAGHLLSEAGLVEAAGPRDADVLIVNTCSIRSKAEEKALSLLGRFRTLKRRNPRLVIAVGGCVAQHSGEALLERMAHVDFVFGPHQVSEIHHLLERFDRTRERFVAVSQRGRETTDDLECPGLPDGSGIKAYMTIMEGCDNFCSYCVVPYTRGRERSRPVQSLREEATRLVEQGVLEITLLGQNVNAYRAPDRTGFGFADLLGELSALDGLRRLRFTTSHPKDLTPELVQCFGRLEPLCEHVHLPLQSGSDPVLSAMNRGYTVSEYEGRVQALRDRVPEIGLTSDMIVGFPGEGREHFRETLRTVERIGFDGFYSFKFSPRPGTRAAGLTDDVAEAEKGMRLQALQALQRRITLARNERWVGRHAEVLVEGRSRDGEQWSGRTRTNRIVNFPGGPELMGRFVGVRIVRACHHSLVGEIEPAATLPAPQAEDRLQGKIP